MGFDFEDSYQTEAEDDEQVSEEEQQLEVQEGEEEEEDEESEGECSHLQHMYSMDWISHFADLADVDLIVNGEKMPAHSTILCQSEVFCRILEDKKCSKSDRPSIESVFDGLSVHDVDLVLTQVYSSRFNKEINSLDQYLRTIEVARKLGFENLHLTVLDILLNSRKHLFEGLGESKNARTMWRWLKVSGCDEYFYSSSSEKLRGLLCQLIARKFPEIIERKNGWKEVSTELDIYQLWDKVALFMLQQHRNVLFPNCT